MRRRPRIAPPFGPVRGLGELRLRSRLLTDRRGVAIVEFALVLPLLVMIYLGGFALCEACATYRKLADTTVETANVMSQYTTVLNTDVQGVMSATAQIMAPYAAANLAMVVSEIQTDNATPTPNIIAVWSQGYQGGVPLIENSRNANVLPASNSLLPNTTYILVEATYNYVPVFGTRYIPSIPLTDFIYVLPRESTSITCTSSVC